MKNVSCVLLGDSCVGKTSLIMAYTTNSFYNEYIPTIFDAKEKKIMYEETQICLLLLDTAGGADFRKMFQEEFCNVDIFILCFSLIWPVSLNNIENIWVPYIKKYTTNIPYILVGLKSDLRDTSFSNKPIPKYKGEKMKRKIKAVDYIECSSLKYYNINNVFESAIKNALNLVTYKRKYQNNTDNNLCSIN